jgi:polyisoprenoid-binding protein YceI
MSDTTTSTTAALPLTTGRWVLDPYHSAVGFTVRHLGISKVQGRFGQLEAELVIGETIEDCSVSATVALGSIDTGNAVRDEHVRAANMLDVERRPTMTFRSTRVHSTGPDWSLQGEMVIGEVTRPVTFEVEFGGVQDSVVDGRRHAGFEASGEIRRSDFGLGFGPGDAIVGDVVKIRIDVQFIEPE